ncbi:NAD(P)-binding oxidoreductase [Rhodococcus opacus]|uniref:NAD(P)-binding oxidoreductase n=1 Tax=Rhodococcus opacus TaxID=37919 RepID=UPI00295498B3|nr:NAD(P)-binding oxidoreductase [Rhodococcus opacus]MDV7088970.1 NAD(P)-binding oxidoreductase [Rhodococcus opacus]
MKVFLIGAAGGVGRRLAAALVAHGDTATGMIRNPEQCESVAQSGATPVAGDLIEDSIDELAAKLAGHDAVVFSAGAHGTGRDFTTLIDGKGVEKAATAAARAGVAQFVLVSTFADSERDKGFGDGFEHYIRVKRGAEIYLTRTDLDWVIVRPGHLLDGAGDGLISAGLALRETDIRRENLAGFIVESLHNPDLNRTIVEVTDGQTPIAQAVAELARSVGPRR